MYNDCSGLQPAGSSRPPGGMEIQQLGGGVAQEEKDGLVEWAQLQAPVHDMHAFRAVQEDWKYEAEMAMDLAELALM